MNPCEKCTTRPCESYLNEDGECWNHALLDALKNLQPVTSIDREAYEADYYKARNEVPPSKR